jgi:mannose-6-phosphate isomerase-like protein (cupin superfamily)
MLPLGARRHSRSGYRVAMSDDPVLLGPGEGEARRNFRILAGRDELVLTEFHYSPGQDGPRRHIHRHHADAFYVLEGRLRITLDEEDRVLDPGGFVLIPPEVIHTFGNPDPEPGRYLNLHAPGMGFDEYLRGRFEEFDQLYDVPPGSGRPTSEALVLNPGEGEELVLGPSRVCIKAGGSDGLGSLAVLDTTIAPGFPGPVLHLHEKTVDSFYVLEGILTLQLGWRTVEADPGSYALVPPGTPHSFSNPGDEPVRILNLMAPAGFERYLQEVAALGGPLDPAQMAEIASTYDFQAI